MIDLRAVSAFHTYADVQSHAARVGSDTVITLDANKLDHAGQLPASPTSASRTFCWIDKT
jgi:hypothetical protein